MGAKLTIKVNPSVAKQLAKQIEQNLKKRGIKAKLSDAEIRNLQAEFNKLGR